MVSTKLKFGLFKKKKNKKLSRITAKDVRLPEKPLKTESCHVVQSSCKSSPAPHLRSGHVFQNYLLGKSYWDFPRLPAWPPSWPQSLLAPGEWLHYSPYTLSCWRENKDVPLKDKKMKCGKAAALSLCRQQEQIVSRPGALLQSRCAPRVPASVSLVGNVCVISHYLAFLPGESHGQRSLVGYSSQGHRESDMTEVAYYRRRSICQFPLSLLGDCPLRLPELLSTPCCFLLMERGNLAGPGNRTFLRAFPLVFELHHFIGSFPVFPRGVCDGHEARITQAPTVPLADPL